MVFWVTLFYKFLSKGLAGSSSDCGMKISSKKINNVKHVIILGVVLSPTTQQTIKTKGARRTALQGVTVNENLSIGIRTWRLYYSARRNEKIETNRKKTGKN